MYRSSVLLLPVCLLGGVGVLATEVFLPPDRPSTTNGSTGAQEVQPVNPRLGNDSFRMVFGRAPTPKTPERLRLQAHLAVVEQFLRQRDGLSLTPAQRARRTELLDALHRYWKDGRFPENTEVPGRSPVFMDANGRLCAVGHLIAESAGREVAEAIDQDYHLAYIHNIDSAGLNAWAERNGFTLRELALVQPTYCGIGGCPPAQEDTETASALEVAGLSASIGASLLNGVLLEHGSPSYVGGAAGMAGGATSLAVGVSGDAKHPTASSAAGAVSLALGGWSLASRLFGDGSADAPMVATGPNQEVQIAPTTVSTVGGDLRPGLRATVEF